MPDMLVKLYELPPLELLLEEQLGAGVDIRRAMAAEKHLVVDWVRTKFSEYWGSECEVSFSNQPVSCYIAVREGELLGFAVYDVTSKGFFGPTGVLEATRGGGIGKVLLIAALHAMRNEGYGYGIIGGVGPADFYAKAVGALMIEDSTPGVYRGMLRPPSAPAS